MEQYCVNCGNKLREGAVFCSSCGKKAATPVRPDTAEVRETARWSEFGNFLSRFCLILAKGFLFLIMSGIVFACAVSGGITIYFGGTLLYNFAVQGFYTLPPVLSSVIGIEGIGGIPLVICGIMLIFVSLLFILLIIAVIKWIYNSRKRDEKY